MLNTLSGAKRSFSQLFSMVIIAGIFGSNIPAKSFPSELGAPITVDVQNPDRSQASLLKPYMIGLRRRIQRYWFPILSDPERKTKISFHLMSNGIIDELRILKSSGDPEFDNMALAAIQSSSPYPSPPSASMVIHITFNSRFANPEEIAHNWQAHKDRQNAILAKQEINIPSIPDHNSDIEPPKAPPYTHVENIATIGSDKTIAPTHLPQQEDSNLEWTIPISLYQYKELSSEQKEHYRSWFSHWLQKAPAERYLFMVPIGQATSIRAKQQLTKKKTP